MALRIEARLRKVEKLARKVRDPDRPTCAVIGDDGRLKRLYFTGRGGRQVRRDVDAPIPKGLRCKVYLGIDPNDLI